jgi:hypothetical protein
MKRLLAVMALWRLSYAAGGRAQRIRRPARGWPVTVANTVLTRAVRRVVTRPRR